MCHGNDWVCNGLGLAPEWAIQHFKVQVERAATLAGRCADVSHGLHETPDVAHLQRGVSVAGFAAVCRRQLQYDQACSALFTMWASWSAQCQVGRAYISSLVDGAVQANAQVDDVHRRHSLQTMLSSEGSDSWEQAQPALELRRQRSIHHVQHGQTCMTAWTSAGDACLQRRRSSDMTAGNMPGTSAQSSTLQPLLVEISSDQARSTFQTSAAGQLGLYQHTTEG